MDDKDFDFEEEYDFDDEDIYGNIPFDYEKSIDEYDSDDYERYYCENHLEKDTEEGEYDCCEEEEAPYTEKGDDEIYDSEQASFLLAELENAWKKREKIYVLNKNFQPALKNIVKFKNSLSELSATISKEDCGFDKILGTSLCYTLTTDFFEVQDRKDFADVISKASSFEIEALFGGYMQIRLTFENVRNLYLPDQE